MACCEVSEPAADLFFFCYCFTTSTDVVLTPEYVLFCDNYHFITFSVA